MMRSRLLLPIAAFVVLAGCFTQRGTDVESPSSRAETTSADSRGLPAEDARTALNAAAPGLRKCRAEGGPSRVEAAVKFDPSGKVSSVDVKPADEPVATCVRAKLSEVALMPWSGAPVTVSTLVRM